MLLIKFCDSDKGNSIFLRNISEFLPDYVASHPICNILNCRSEDRKHNTLIPVSSVELMYLMSFIFNVCILSREYN
jgi:hypothetical protein